MRQSCVSQIVARLPGAGGHAPLPGSLRLTPLHQAPGGVAAHAALVADGQHALVRRDADPDYVGGGQHSAAGGIEIHRGHLPAKGFALSAINWLAARELLQKG